MFPASDQFPCLMRRIKCLRDSYLNIYITTTTKICCLHYNLSFLPETHQSINWHFFTSSLFWQRSTGIRTECDRLWHTGLLIKLQVASVSWNVHAWFADCLSDRKQHDIFLVLLLIGLIFALASLRDQFFALFFFFLLYISNIVNDIGSNIQLFADDTSLFLLF